MYIRKNDIIGSIVSRNFQAGSVFNSYGIDYYSRGERSLEHACLEDNVTMSGILEELWDLNDQRNNTPDFINMDLTDLSVYILRTHHKFTERKVIFIKHALDKLMWEHRENETQVDSVRKTFEDLSLYLTVHMKHEEFVVFPFIQKMMKAKSLKFSKSADLEHPIAAMKDDHTYEVSILKKLSEMTDSYLLPAHAGYGLRITYGAMKELEMDLRIHMHLENNILFPKALKLAGAIGQNFN